MTGTCPINERHSDKSHLALIYQNKLPLRNQLGRKIWDVVWLLLFRPSPRILHSWRRQLLRYFGATIEEGAHPYPGCRVWAPWNLHMAKSSCLGDGAECYNVAPVYLGPYVTVSQNVFLCTASHDISSREFSLVTKPIRVEAYAWVAARSFIGPGVTIGEGAVISATASVFCDVEPWTIMRGNPAIKIRSRQKDSYFE